MILIGTMNLARTRETGTFDCPTCGDNQEYRLKSRRPFLTLYFIPVVPIGPEERFVVCLGCRDKWDQTVLEMNHQQREAIQTEQFHEEAFRASILVVLADGVISDEEIESLQRIGSRLRGNLVDREELGELCSVALQNQISARNYVLTVSRRWNQNQRVEALQAMFLAATAEGKMGDQQTALMTEMRDILEMTDQEYESAIESALGWDYV
jgi:uncharacterized tellurite resistance protein B-like protein